MKKVLIVWQLYLGTADDFGMFPLLPPVSTPIKPLMYNTVCDVYNQINSGLLTDGVNF